MPRAGLDTAQVVAAGVAIADAEGLEAVTLARVAAALDVRAPSLYSHVAGVEDLRRRIGLEAIEGLREALAGAAAGRSRTEALRAIGHAYRRFAVTRPGSYAATQRRPDPDDSEQIAATAAVAEIVFAALRGYGLEGDAAVHAVRAARAALHGFALLETNAGFGIDLSLDDSFEALLGVLDRGLASAAAAP